MAVIKNIILKTIENIHDSMLKYKINVNKIQ
jgi:hypothetical protein